MAAQQVENHLHNTVRIVGLPEKVEGCDPTAFVEQWLLEIFGKDVFTPLLAVEWAHHIPLRPLPPGNKPRSMLARMLK